MIILKPEDYGVDNSKPEFKTYFYVFNDADGENTITYEWDDLNVEHPEYIKDILKAMAEGQHYVGIGDINSFDYMEFQWD